MAPRKLSTLFSSPKQPAQTLESNRELLEADQGNKIVYQGINRSIRNAIGKSGSQSGWAQRTRRKKKTQHKADTRMPWRNRHTPCASGVGLLRDPDFRAGLRRYLPIRRPHLNLPQQTHNLLRRILFPRPIFKLLSYQFASPPLILAEQHQPALAPRADFSLSGDITDKGPLYWRKS
jgi:hypothetical protein